MVVTRPRTRIFSLVCALALLMAFGMPARPLAAPAAPVPAVQAESAAAPAEGESHESWTPTITKILNFAALAGLLVYFLRTPIVTHLQNRSQQIRKDLVDAATLRAEGEQRLAAVRAQLAALPRELEDLRRRGQEDLASERVRMAEGTARERERLLERTKRDIDLQFRVARRALLEHTAELAMSLARTRVTREITPADQARLLDQYATDVRSEARS